jgi:chaperone modulatory protein CbpM
MEYNIVKVYHGQLVEDEKELTLAQLCKICQLPPMEIIEMINEGIVDPVGQHKKDWRFSYENVVRIRKVYRLLNDLGLNLAGAALALHLIDRIEQLESMVGGKQH